MHYKSNRPHTALLSTHVFLVYRQFYFYNFKFETNVIWDTKNNNINRYNNNLAVRFCFEVLALQNV